MRSICVIGAGQLGSRHLQALKAVSTPLDITVIDPFSASLKIARERYDSAYGANTHKVKYLENLKTINQAFDIAIVATNSNVRREVIEQLLAHSSVRYFILEKLLFQRRKDYEIIAKLLKKNHCQAWINCAMRTMPFYANIKSKVRSPIVYVATGSQYGLITTSIHYIDHMAYMTGCYDYQLISDGLIPELVPSKRQGFMELNGTLAVHFKNGSFGAFTCFPEGNLPVHVEIHSEDGHFVSRENEQKAWIANAETEWLGQETTASLPFQSQMTTTLVEDILKTGNCALTTYEKSAKLHLILLEGLRTFLSKHHKKKLDFYPFT